MTSHELATLLMSQDDMPLATYTAAGFVPVTGITYCTHDNLTEKALEVCFETAS